MRLVEYEPGVGHLLLVLLLPFSWAFFVDQTSEEALNYSFSSNKKWPTFVDCCRCRGRVLVAQFGLKKPQKTTQFPILSGNNKTTTEPFTASKSKRILCKLLGSLISFTKFIKGNWNTFQLPEFQFFDVLLCLHTADHLTSPCL